MKRVKFSGTDPNEKQFAEEVRKNVNAYFRENGISTRGNATMYIKTFVMLSLYLAPFIILLSVHTGVWIGIAFVILMGIGEAGIGMSVMHDAAHGSYSDNKFVNEVFASTMYLMGTNKFNWKIQHNILHHTFTNIYGFDPDIETKAVIRLCSHAPARKYQRFQQYYAFFFYGLMTLAKLLSDLGQLLEFNRDGITEEQHRKPGKEVFKLVVIKIAYFAIILGLPFLFTSYTWWQILIGFSILHLTAGMIMSTVFQMAHVVEGTDQPLPDANGVIHMDWMAHQLHTTSDFARNNFILNWYVGGLNFQIEHHLFSNICHVHYKKIAPIVERTARQFGLPYNLKPTFGSALASHARRLKTLGELPPEPQPAFHL
ncbi:MAG TPA: acyl-CoA desaturase [Bacteroidia bacterium]|jgi:linoleoyl-CoA desaturase|nr:acyl-CoA desaturase [Bacteroidia bacterium]